MREHLIRSDFCGSECNEQTIRIIFNILLRVWLPQKISLRKSQCVSVFAPNATALAIILGVLQLFGANTDTRCDFPRIISVCACCATLFRLRMRDSYTFKHMDTCKVASIDFHQLDSSNIKTCKPFNIDCHARVN